MMTCLQYCFCPFMMVSAVLLPYAHILAQNNSKTGRAYFFNNAGDDANDGSKTKPWKTTARLNSTRLNPGDTVYFEGGQIFTGSILLMPAMTEIEATRLSLLLTVMAGQ